MTVSELTILEPPLQFQCHCDLRLSLSIVLVELLYQSVHPLIIVRLGVDLQDRLQLFLQNLLERLRDVEFGSQAKLHGVAHQVSPLDEPRAEPDPAQGLPGDAQVGEYGQGEVVLVCLSILRAEDLHQGLRALPVGVRRLLEDVEIERRLLGHGDALVVLDVPVGGLFQSLHLLLLRWVRLRGVERGLVGLDVHVDEPFVVDGGSSLDRLAELDDFDRLRELIVREYAEEDLGHPGSFVDFRVNAVPDPDGDAIVLE